MLELGYILLTFLVILIILFVYRYALSRIGLEKKEVNKRLAYAVFGLLAWLIYIYFMSKNGFLSDYSLPPRFPIFTIFPLFIFTGIVLYKNRNSEVFNVIPQSWSIYFQTFRIAVESLFVGTVAIGLLHKEVTIEGYNFDMVFAFTAPIIGYLIFKAKLLPKKIAILWNYIGLVVLVSVILIFTTTTFAPALWGSITPLSPPEMVSFPYILVAAFLMPVAVFVHIFSIMQLRKAYG